LKCRYADPHLHPNPIKGLGGKAIASKARKAGFWLLGFLTLPPWDYNLEPSLDNYEKIIRMIIRECREASSSNLKVKCFAGFHPSEIDKLIDRYNIKPIDALNLGYKVLDIIREKCLNGELDGIGEVGHQHYKTWVDRALITHLILEKALLISEEADCPIQMHLENNEHSTVEIIKMTLDRIGVRTDKRIIFHHAKPSMSIKAFDLGLSSTIPGTNKRLVEYLVNNIPPVYMLESDYVDDKGRPNAFYPWDLADLQEKLIREGAVDEEYICRINHDNPVKALKL
jgi:TatD-related deoxyribonuclease